MGRILILGSVITCVCVMLVGCVSSRRDDVLTRLMRDIERSKQPEPSVTDRRDAPEKPISNLPLISGEFSDEGRMAGGSADLTIQPDCLIQITVKEDPSLDGSYPVNEIGAVELNYVGPVILYNKTERGAEAKIREVLTAR
ncbi:MAG: polysaccharide biosynthesis/export family protein, partial [Lentisphaerae bacterium]|nr:polysaccharide biosynthesis/export family protein [Lentisphaerota bacterium]